MKPILDVEELDDPDDLPPLDTEELSPAAPWNNPE
jgi:hypothetical protein